MDQEKDGIIPFRDVEVSRQPDGTLTHLMKCKPTHPGRYLYNRSFQLPSIKSSVNRSEERLLKNPNQDSNTRSCPDQRVTYTQGQPNSKINSVTLPYLDKTSHQIQRNLSRQHQSILDCTLQDPESTAIPQGQTRPKTKTWCIQDSL